MKKMKTKTKRRLAIQYFLRKLKQRMESDKVNQMDAVWLNIYAKEDLIDIIKWLYVPTVPEWIKLDEMDEEELLEAIGDDFHILSYEIEQARLELYENTKFTYKSVFDTLHQLGLDNHYLMTKPLAQWDDYDKSNYSTLYQKAGKPTPFYGIFNSTVKEEDKYLTPPIELHESEFGAQSALFLILATQPVEGTELKIMML